MKWNKLAILNGMIAVALWISTARAAGQNFQPLHFKLTVLQQQPMMMEATRSTNGYGSSRILSAPDINASKLTNKGLLSLLASAFDTNWPAGADLAVDRWSGNIFVVDATGTNPVFNASEGLNIDETNVAFFRCERDQPVSKSHALSKTMPGGGSQHFVDGTSYGMVFFHLFIEQDGVTNTDLSFAGLDTTDYHSHLIRPSNSVPAFVNSFYRTKETIPVIGDGVLDETWSVVRGTVTSLLVQKGAPPVGVLKQRPPEPPIEPPIPVSPPPLSGFTNVFTNIVVPPIVIRPPILLTNTSWPVLQ